MIKEAYVSFEVARLLKEKGFIIPCNWLYCKDGSFGHRNSVWDKEMFPAPTQQMAMRWLREVHKIFIEIRIYFAPKLHYRADVLEFNNLEDIQWLDDLAVLPMKDTYEEAVEAAIKYCLENLI